MSFNPVHFVPASEKASMLALPVRSILAVGHRQKADTNHWCLYLSTPQNTSVRIDCQPSYSVPSTVLPGGSKANVVISRLNCPVSMEAEKSFDLAVKPNLTAADVYNTIIEHNRHKYEFDSEGVGCRCWTSGQLDFLLQQQILTNASEVAAVKEGILKLWPAGTPLALDQGAYYQ
ncbi:predicted protein [Uncinocarpus reesii 1704]|uniref:DUF7770 domain-containing protein n=1 Tax=Uncinocarpus reesii (strain UAMH 1704) TaxID=336963 RepID=C4JQ33_UNCRE|nr:uncharacterized protein UREG_03266 [Uncinocarpus reesii 1704]EEP78420.1 predicted protein [Uncinocarpus reesii 1704]